MVQLTVVIPTFNERANVRPLYERLGAALAGRSWEAVFVDDDSPDGTADEVRALAGETGNVRVLQRIGRRGLAGACIEGMLSAASPYCAVIDADLQHDETLLPQMLDLIEAEGLDLVIGTRLSEEGSTGGGLSRFRRFGTDRATALAKRLLGITVSDPMSGFFCIRRTAFNEVVTELQPAGFKILADMLSVAKGRWTVRELPYEFRPREHGESKMDAAVVAEFFALLVARLTSGLVSVRFVLFAAVGLSGVVVQLAVVRLVLAFWPDSFTQAQIAGTVVAIASNYALNNFFTYRDRSLRGRAFWRGLASFYAVCSFGALINVAIAGMLYAMLPLWALASLAGAVAGAMWNFITSALFTWRAK